MPCASTTERAGRGRSGGRHEQRGARLRLAGRDGLATGFPACRTDRRDVGPEAAIVQGTRNSAPAQWALGQPSGRPGLTHAILAEMAGPERREAPRARSMVSDVSNPE